MSEVGNGIFRPVIVMRKNVELACERRTNIVQQTMANCPHLELHECEAYYKGKESLD